MSLPNAQVENATMTVEELRQQCIDSYAVFCCYMQDDGYFDEVHKELCQWTQYHVEQAEKEVEETGTCLLELAYIMPRGSLKSTIVTKHLSAWLTIRRFYKFKDSSYRTLIAGNTFNNASSKMHGDLGGLFITHTLFKQLFPEVLPRRGQNGNTWSTSKLEINREGSFAEGTFECAGTNTKLIGRHYNTVVEDDTTAPDISDLDEGITRPSRETIAQAVGFHQASTSLFIPKDFRCSIVVSTRWGCEDLIQHIQDKERYKYFSMPAMGEDGTPHFTCFYQGDTLEKIKSRVGEYMFSMLYLNKPLDDSLRVFNPENFSYATVKEAPQAGFFTIAVDPAISEKDKACESSITVNQHVRRGYGRHEYWWEDVNCRLLPFQLANKILDLAEKYAKEIPNVPLKAIIIESNAWQYALKSILQNEMERRGIHFNIVPMVSRQQKELRIESMQPSFEQRRIHFIKDRISLQTEQQLVAYPNGRLVDTIDSWSMHRRYVRKDNKKDRGYIQEKQQEAATKDPMMSAFLELEAMKKRHDVATLAPPKPHWREGIVSKSLTGQYGGIK